MRDGDTPLGDLTLEHLGHGTLGWQTLITAPPVPEPTEIMCQGDVTPPMVKGIEDTEWRDLIVPGKVPARLIGTAGGAANGMPGAMQGGYHSAYGGTNPLRKYLAIQDGVITCTDGETFTDTAITGLPVGSNNGTPQRSFGQKGAADPTNELFYSIIMGQHGLHYTLDGGATKVSPTWLPKPVNPLGGTYPVGVDSDHSWGIIAIDHDSAMTAAGPTSRRSRAAYGPSGRGVWVSMNGGVSGTDITGASGVTSVSDMTWVNGLLVVVACDNSGSGFQKNIYTWNGSGTLVRGNTGLNDNLDYTWRFVIRDPLTTNGFWLQFENTGEYAYLPAGRGGTVHSYLGDQWVGEPPVGYKWLFKKMKPRTRPMVADKFRSGGNWAQSRPAFIGEYIYAATGEGIVRTPLADFPIPWNGTYAGLPTWEEDAGGSEEIVGQCPLWMRDELICGGQDIAIIRAEDGRRGHRASVRRYPKGLSDVHGLSKGLTPGYGVARLTRQFQQMVPQFSYTLTNGGRWTKMANQPMQGPASMYESGHGVAGAAGVALCFPTRHGARPQITEDFGDTEWANLRFWKGATELDLTPYEYPDGYVDGDGNTFDPNRSFRGFQGAGFATQQHQCCIDPTTGIFWCFVNGASDNQAATSWELDPLGHAGLYKMEPGDYPNFRQDKAGHPTDYLNRAGFGCKLIADGNGHLVFLNTYLPGSPLITSNPGKVYDIATKTWSSIANPQHIVTAAFGAPYPGDTQPCLWMVGWKQSAAGLVDYGVFYSRNLGATSYGPFTARGDLLKHGYINDIDVQTDEPGFKAPWGMLAASIKSRGHAILKFELAA